MLKAGDEAIPGYQLERFLGKGQFGQVWQCTTPGKARAALKFLDLSGKQGWKEFRGIQRVKAIRHPHLMPITALWLLDENWHVIDDSALAAAEAKTTQKVDETLAPSSAPAGPLSNWPEPRWLVVAQLLGDQTLGSLLHEHLQRGEPGIPVEQLLRYMEEAAKGIDFLNSSVHDLGEGRVAVQHCDIKPDNILLVGDSVLICDFGVVHVLAPDTSTTATGMVGSPAYMAPECVERKPSPASDQYSLAITYVELRTGKLPFKSESYYEVIDAHRKGNLDLSRLSPAERAVIRKATSVNPEDRYATVGDMVRDLRRAVEGKTPDRPSRRRQAVMLGITVVALVTAILLALPYLRPSPQGQGQVPQTHTYQLHVIPANARVTMDDQPLEVDAAGRASFQRLSSESVRLTVSKDPEYQEERRQIALSDHLDREIEVRLKHRPDFLMRRALESWRGGDASGALDDAVAAIEQDGAFAVFPAPLYRLSKGERRGIGRMSISPDGRWIVCGDQTGRVLVWDLQSSDRSFPALGIHKHDDAVESIAVGRQWVASADLAGQVQVSRLGSDLAPPQTLQLTENLVKLMITPDDHWLISGSDDGSGKYVLQRWDLQSSALPSTGVKLGEHGGMIDEILLPAGQATVITASWDRTVREWSLESPASAGQGRLLGQLTGDVYCLARVGDNIVFAGDGGNALEADANTAEPRYRRHRIVLVPLDGQACREFPEGHEEQIEALTSSASGRWLASGSVDGMVQVWEVVQQQPRGPVVLAGRHSSKINALSFDPSGQWLVSGGNEGNVVVWDVQNPAKSAVIGRHDGPVTQAIVLPDGSAVISCGEDGSVRQWDLPKCQLILRACDRLGIEPKPYAEPKDQVEA